MEQSEPISAALDALMDSRSVVLINDLDADSDAVLAFSGELAVPDLVAFTVRHSSGFLVVALTDADADRLDLPLMHAASAAQPAYTVAVDAAAGIGTGISAPDRCHTIHLLSDPVTVPDDLTRPGHVVPMRARSAGVLERAGIAEAAVDLMVSAGLRPTAVLGSVVSSSNPTRMAKATEGREFAEQHGLTVVTVSDVVAHRRSMLVRPTGHRSLFLGAGDFEAHTFADLSDDREHLALISGAVRDGIPVAVHLECPRGLVGSLNCHCRKEFDDSLMAVAGRGGGAVLHIASAAPRRSALFAPDGSAHLQWGIRDREVAARILATLGFGEVTLLVPDAELTRALQQYQLRVRAPGTRPEPDSALSSAAEPHTWGLWWDDPEPAAIVTGTVVHGDARGRELGFPTANLDLAVGSYRLPDGVYAGVARTRTAVGEPGTLHVAAISVGTNPTFPGGAQRFEVHLLDFAGDLYGATMEVLPQTFIRPTLAFESVDALVTQIQGDVEEIRRLVPARSIAKSRKQS